MPNEYAQLKAHRSDVLMSAYYELIDKYDMSLIGIANRVLDVITSLDNQEQLKLYTHFCFLVKENNC